MRVVNTHEFRRARSADSKRQRAASLVEAAQQLAMERGVRSVTLSAVAERAGVHHSAVRRYFDSHKDVLLHLAAEGWNRWSEAICSELPEHGTTPGQLAQLLTRTLVADPLLCDLLGNVPLHLEPDVSVDRVLDFKRSSRAAIDRMQHAITTRVPGFSDTAAYDAITATNALGATLWQVTHPAAPLAAALSTEPGLVYLDTDAFASTMVRLLTATFTGLGASGTGQDPRATRQRPDRRRQQ